MSFAQKTKDELVRISIDKECCQLAELAALIRMDGVIQISGGGKLSLNVTTEMAGVARKIFTLTKKLFKIHTEILVRRKARLKKNYIYLVRIPPQEQVREVLDAIGILKTDGDISPDIKRSLISSDCCKRAYLRGVFLGGGSVNNPEGTYHLEIVVNDFNHSQEIVNLLKTYGLEGKINQRKSCFMVYLKGSEEIVDFLNIVGAHKALLDFENVRIVKGMRNQVNRLVNCETANLSKTVNAAVRQVENIKLIDQKLGLGKLSKGLKEVAEMRLNYPDVSLKELGDLMDPVVSKSGINHRMRKLEKIAEKL